MTNGANRGRSSRFLSAAPFVSRAVCHLRCPSFALFVNPPGNGIKFGALNRNQFRGPWFNGLNAALFKNFRVTESMKLRRFAELTQWRSSEVTTTENRIRNGKQRIIHAAGLFVC